MGKGLAADAAMHGNHPLRRCVRVVVQCVIAYMIRNGDHAVAGCHHGAVTADGIVAVHAGDEYRPPRGFHFSQCAPADPGREP